MEFSPLTVLMVTLAGLFAIGVPIFMSLAISAALSLLVSDILPLSVIHTSLFEGLNIFPLLAIPCFIVAGSLMEHGNITHEIVDVVKILAGRMYGGIGITTLLACAFFAAITGSGASTVAAVGSILIPAMLRNGYSREYAGAVSSSGGTLGILIPPSNPMIMYAIICNISVTAMFTAGFMPGFLVLFALCSVAYVQARRQGFKGDADQEPFDVMIFLRAVKKGFFSLATVVVVLGSIYTGFATPVEASIVAVLWALFVGKVINKTLKMEHVRMALREGAMICGAILIIVGTSALFGRILTYEQAPERIANAVVAFTTNKYLVLLMIVGVMYILGMFMESLAMIILITPVILPVMGKLGIDPLHFGILLVIATQVGLLTPPLGVNLFVASKVAGTTVERLSVSALPYIGVMTLVVLLILFFPSIATWLPYTLGMGG